LHLSKGYKYVLIHLLGLLLWCKDDYKATRSPALFF
jgi:hypothetical protein